jgi:hypothetical protein
MEDACVHHGGPPQKHRLFTTIEHRRDGGVLERRGERFSLTRRLSNNPGEILPVSSPALHCTLHEPVLQYLAAALNH